MAGVLKSELFPAAGLGVDSSVAFWISPEGEFIGTHGSHTSTVMETPESFGLTAAEAQRLFQNGEEKAVITHLLEQGWIRGRNQFSSLFISVQTLTPAIKDFLVRYLVSVAKGSDLKVIIDESSSGEVYRTTIQKAREGTFSGASFQLTGQVLSEYQMWSVLGNGQNNKPT